MDVDLTDDEQMLRAIALSLGENVVMSTDQVSPVGILVSSVLTACGGVPQMQK